MKRNNGKRGFTMAEMLIVVAIIAVLGSVAFVAVAQHQRSMERLERDSVAREIFVAAQNHLTMAQGQGYSGISGTEESMYGHPDKDGVYYFVVNRGDLFGSNSLLDQMLPFGAVDETVRVGGNFIIRYHPETATVMDVFYTSNDSRFGQSLNASDYSELLSTYAGDDKQAARRNYKDGKVIGWYGGATAEVLAPEGEPLEAPDIFIDNAEKLRVFVSDNSDGRGSLQVIVTGLTSGVKKTFTLRDSSNVSFSVDTTRIDAATTTVIDKKSYGFCIVLDDITNPGLHFADLRGYKVGSTEENEPFIPGEDVTVQAIAYDNTQLSNIAYSVTGTTNSLFEKIQTATSEGTTTSTALINNIRHLENLDNRISNVVNSDAVDAAGNPYTLPLSAARQTNDLSWKTFKDNTDVDTNGVYEYENTGTYGESAVHTDPRTYKPVSPTTYKLHSYNGYNHSVTGVKVNYAGDAGMFGAVGDTDAPAEIKNLALIDFEIKGTGEPTTDKDGNTVYYNAGALAGTLTNVTVTNVVAYGKTSQVTATGGHAGGLTGYANNCTISRSAAAVIVKSDAQNAGGLVGSISGGSVSACYSGGHTTDAAYSSESYNVTAPNGVAGGLIGDVRTTPIENSYSTCSVTGETAGGFVGDSSGSANNCYATGLVQGTQIVSNTTTVDGVITTTQSTKDGAFAFNIAEATGCHYIETVNQREDAAKGYTCLPALGPGKTNTAITPLDADVDTFNAFVGAPEDVNNPWTPASAYDPKLIGYYNGKFNLKSISRLLGVTLSATDFVATHYGDWPAPEIFVLNELNRS